MRPLPPLLALCAGLLSGAALAQDEAAGDGAPEGNPLPLEPRPAEPRPAEPPPAEPPPAEPPPDPELLGLLAALGEAAGDGSLLALFDLLLDETPLGAGAPADGAREDGP